jgi:hypothetical protein
LDWPRNDYLGRRDWGARSEYRWQILRVIATTNTDSGANPLADSGNTNSNTESNAAELRRRLVSYHYRERPFSPRVAYGCLDRRRNDHLGWR